MSARMLVSLLLARCSAVRLLRLWNAPLLIVEMWLDSRFRLFRLVYLESTFDKRKIVFKLY